MLSRQEGTCKLRGYTSLSDGFCVTDSSNSGGENMYTMMKSVPGGNMPGVSVVLILNAAFIYIYMYVY